MDGKDGVDDVRRKLLGQSAVQLRAKRCPRDGKEEFTVDFPFELELLEKLYTIIA